MKVFKFCYTIKYIISINEHTLWYSYEKGGTFLNTLQNNFGATSVNQSFYLLAC